MVAINKASWESFEKHTSNAFTNWRDNAEFSDVTLACDGGKKFKAHRLVLSPASSVFQKILSL